MKIETAKSSLDIVRDLKKMRIEEIPHQLSHNASNWLDTEESPYLYMNEQRLKSKWAIAAISSKQHGKHSRGSSKLRPQAPLHRDGNCTGPSPTPWTTCLSLPHRHWGWLQALRHVAVVPFWGGPRSSHSRGASPRAHQESRRALHSLQALVQRCSSRPCRPRPQEHSQVNINNPFDLSFYV